jgi:hypothetical protein
VWAGGGVSEWDASVGVTVAETGTNGGGKSVDAWNVGGPGFVSLGGGLRHAFTPRFAMTIGPRFNLAFGSNGTLPSISPELGIAYGF